MENNHSTRVSIHSIKNILGSQEQVSLFSNHDKDFAEEHNVEVFNSIERFGIELSDTQFRVMEGILRGFSETEYKGNLSPKDKNELVEEKFCGKEPDFYKYIREIPRLMATQSQILDWSDINKNSIASKIRALEALDSLSTTQYCFYYDRLAFSKDGKPIKKRDGSWIKEQVTAIDTLFTIKKISDKNTGFVQYYEITPSVIFLDQIDGYFILIPFKWREEVRKLFGNKKASAYTFRFLIFLRYQYELRRRSQKKSEPYTIEWSPEEVAVALKMPESIYVKKKKKMNEILEDAYSVAKKLGYISDYKRKGYLDILQLNSKKYSIQTSGRVEVEKNEVNQKIDDDAEELLEFFVLCRRKIDPNYEIDQKCKKNIDPFKSLMEKDGRSKVDIKAIIQWSQSQSFWVSQLSSPIKIRNNFSEAWSEMMLSSNFGKEIMSNKNREIAINFSKKFSNLSSKARIEVLSKYVEIGNGVHQPTCISYDSPNFKEKLSEGLKKWGITF